jgi:hypothetical protein
MRHEKKERVSDKKSRNPFFLDSKSRFTMQKRLL